MSERTHASVEYCLSIGTERCFSMANADDTPDVIIIDHDYPGTATRLSKSNWQQDIPLVILTTNNIDIAGAIMVRKPVDTTRLKEAANKALAQLIRLQQLAHFPQPTMSPQALKGNSKTRDNLERARAKVELMCGPHRTLEQLSKPNDLDHRFDPTKTLSDRIKIAIQKENSGFKAIQFKLPEDDVFVFPTLGKVFTSTGLNVRKSVNRVYQDQADVQVLTHQSAAANQIIDRIKNSSSTSFSTEAFLWLSALFGARGRLPIGFDTTTTLHLNQWPKLTSLELTPYCMEITAALASNPASMSQVVEQLQCEPRHMTSFINAAIAIDVLSVGKQP